MLRTYCRLGHCITKSKLLQIVAVLISGVVPFQSPTNSTLGYQFDQHFTLHSESGNFIQCAIKKKTADYAQ